MNEETTIILIDTALASGSASALDPEERKLQELVLVVRDDAPALDPDFALRMNARVAAGFPPSRAGMRGRLFAMRRPPMLAMAAAATLLIALVVTISVTRNSGRVANIPAATDAAGGSATSGSATSGSAASGSSESAPSLQSAPAQKAPSSGSVAGVAPLPPQPGSGFVGGGNRKVERSAELVLAAPKDKISEVGDQVIAVTDRYRGFVLRSSVTSADAQSSSGSFDLRIPVGSLRPALRDMSALADVKSRTENADDITASFAGARTRLQELNAERRGLLRRLERAQTDLAASSIRARIRIVNAQIESQTTVLNNLRRRTSYAAVSVTLQAKQGGSGGGTGIGKGARDLRDSLVDSANLSLRVLGVAIPIALLIALLWAGSSWFTRRRRESVLG